MHPTAVKSRLLLAFFHVFTVLLFISCRIKLVILEFFTRKLCKVGIFVSKSEKGKIKNMSLLFV